VAYFSAFLTYIYWLTTYYPFVKVFYIAFYKMFISTKSGTHIVFYKTFI
jgi:hypothetical protein